MTYENGQARERTQILMDIANQTGGIVIGTGDLSELALGWATYNGDHMSMYGVNASIPKTLVRYLVAYEANPMRRAICMTCCWIFWIRPSLRSFCRPTKTARSRRKRRIWSVPTSCMTSSCTIMCALAFAPRKIFRLACLAFAETYDKQTIMKWLKKFYWRFFSQQFKRSCLPDGPKVGSVTLSPRGDWRMPSDASVQVWIKELEEIELSGGMGE